MKDPFWTQSATYGVRQALLNVAEPMGRMKRMIGANGLNYQARNDLEVIAKWCREYADEAQAILDAEKSNDQKAA